MAVPRVPKVYKTPTEVRTATLDFTDKLAVGDTLTGSATMVYPSGLTEVTTTRSGNKVNTRMSGGTDGTVYRVIGRCATTSGDTLSLQLDVFVDAEAN